MLAFLADMYCIVKHERIMLFFVGGSMMEQKKRQ